MKKILLAVSFWLLAVSFISGQSLTSIALNESYGGLLHFNGNWGVTPSFQIVYDGLGNATALQLSTTGVKFPTPWTLGTISVTATGTEINYLAGVTSGIQAQLNSKVALSSFQDSLKFLQETKSWATPKNDYNIGIKGILTPHYITYGNVAKSGDTLFYAFTTTADNRVLMRKSYDNGDSWSDTATVYRHIPVGDTHISESITFNIISSTWYLVFSNNNASDSTVSMVFTKSTNRGSTWSNEVTIPTTFKANATSDIVKLSSGRLLFAFDEAEQPYEATDSGYVKVAHSNNDGTTWSIVTVNSFLFGVGSYTDAHPITSEPSLAADANDRLFMTCRNEIKTSTVWTSVDSGEVWTNEGIIGQTMNAPRLGKNPSTDVIVVNDSVFVVAMGHRTETESPKKGYFCIRITTYNAVHGNAATGFKTLLSSSFIPYDPGSNRIVLNKYNDLIVVNGQDGYYCRIPRKLMFNNNFLIETNRFRNNASSVFVTWDYYYPNPIFISNSSYQTIAYLSYPNSVNYQALGGNINSHPIGSIPVIDLIYYGDTVATDTLAFKLTDVSSNNITSELKICASASSGGLGWRMFIPPDSNASTEAELKLRVRTTSATGYTARKILVRGGYVIQ